MYEPGSTITTSISLMVIILSAIMYVDDTDIFVVGKHRESLDELLARAQLLSQRWTDALWATGGVLRPEKCWWYMVSFKWNGSKWRYARINESEGEILVPDHARVATPVSRIEYNTPMRTLGVRIAADGNTRGEKEYLLSKSIEWSDQIKKAFLYRSETALALTTTIARTWAYPLQATSFSKSECEDIMKPAYKIVLSKMGINRNIPLVYRYAPKSMNGLGVPHIYTMQGCAHIKSTIDHINSGTKLGTMMTAQLEAINIELGTDKHLFLLHYPTWNRLLTDCWFKQICFS